MLSWLPVTVNSISTKTPGSPPCANKINKNNKKNILAPNLTVKNKYVYKLLFTFYFF
tara:strand:- start:356 stop:526 length:171 start_codon:yes stop_codon:yes gene_type:complete